MRKKKIAIIGLGIGGLNLAYGLAKEELFDITIFTNKSAEDIQEGRIPSTQVHFEKMLKREKLYSMPEYGEVNELKKVELKLNGQKLFKGNLHNRAISIDQRIYLPTLMNGLENLNVDIVHRRVNKENLTSLGSQFDLIIDSSGKNGPIASFEPYEWIKKPYSPLRICSAGFFYGLDSDEENKLSFNILPGQGELFEMSIVTKNGLARSLLLEAVPGGKLDIIKGDRGAEDFADKMKNVLSEFFPEIYKRVHPEKFRLIDDMAYTRMAIKPELRIPYTMINQTLVIGCGDSVFLNDPITGQGANTTSYCAEELRKILVDNARESWGISLGIQYWDRIKQYVVQVSEWTNAMMGPLSSSFLDFINDATKSQEVADEFVNMFHDPQKAYNVFFGTYVH